MSRRRHAESGQSMAELALVLPVFLMLIFGVLDFGRVVWANTSLAHASREAARFAIVQQTLDLPPKDEIRQLALDHAIAGGENLVVDVCYGAGCSGDADAPGVTYERGTPVTVSIRGSVSAVTGALFGFGSVDVGGSTTMIVNN